MDRLLFTLSFILSLQIAHAEADPRQSVGEQSWGYSEPADASTYTKYEKDLREADLRGVVFRRVDLSGAQLQGADLSGAVFEDVILDGANLSDADLRRTQFRRNVSIEGADFRGAKYSQYTLLPFPQVPFVPFDQLIAAQNGMEYVKE